MRFRHTLLASCILLTPIGAFAEPIEFHKTISVPITDEDIERRRGGGGQVSNIIYVNDCKPGGCVITAGNYNDAIEDVSTVPNLTTLLSPFQHDQEVWDQTMQCLQEVFGPYNIELVTEDPGMTPHHEAILAGDSTELGLPADVLGIAPVSCDPIDNAISFSLANSMQPDWIRMCWTVAQESAHAFSLDHEFDCSDPMTYIPNCGQKFFRDKDFECGDFDIMPCRCGGDTQNSHAILTSVFGEGTPPPPPNIQITFPEDGSSVEDTFVVLAEALDPRLIDRIEVYVNDWLYETLEGYEYYEREEAYLFDPSDNLPEGVMNIELIAYNDLDVSASTSITVTKGAACTSAASCNDGQECRDGGCYWLPPTGQIGDACDNAMDCESLLCPRSAAADMLQVCSQYCSVGIQGDCPESYRCVGLRDDPQTGVCWPEPVVEETGCSVGDARGVAGGQFVLFILVMGVLSLSGSRRRRRQP